MGEYKLTVTTGDMKHAGTIDRIYITLFGTEGQSERTELDNIGIDFKLGTVSSILFLIRSVVDTVSTKQGNQVCRTRNQGFTFIFVILSFCMFF